MRSTITRRRLLGTAAAAGGVAAFAGPWKHNRVYAQASDKPIRIGITSDASGQYANSGASDRRGMLMAIAEANEKGGVLKRQVELQIEQITNLEFIGGALSGLNEIADLYNSAEDLRDRAAKITDLGGFADALALGDFDALMDTLLDGEVTMGEKHAAAAMRDTLETAGLTSDRLGELSSSENPQDALIARTAGTSATAMAAAQISYEEAEASLERINGLVREIARQETLKESVDLNTRMAAETNFMLGQMWRLNAAAGLAQGQTGVNWAAEQAKERRFFDYSGSSE